MSRLVTRSAPINPNPITGGQSYSEPKPTGMERVGVAGLDLLGGGTGLVGDVARNAIGGLGEVVNTPLEIITGQVAEARLERSLVGNDGAVDPRFIKMVTEQGMSVSDVADQMANEGVAVTGGVAHDLLIGVFLDPFNLIAAGIGKSYDIGKKSSGIQERLNSSAVGTISESAGRNGASKEDVAWLNGGNGRRFLGSAYSLSSQRLGGLKRGMAQAMFGRATGMAAAAIGIRTLSKILDVAQGAGKGEALLRAAGIGVNNLSLSAASDLVVRRAFAEVRKTAMEKAKIFARSTGVEDKNTYDEYVKATGYSPDGGDFTIDEVRREWEDLHATVKLTDEQEAASVILKRDVAGMVNEDIGKRGTLRVLETQRAMDETGIRRQISAQKEVYVSENLFTLSAGATDAEKVSLAAEEFISNLSPLLGEAAARQAWDAVLAEARIGNENMLRALAEAMYSSQILRLGTVADGFAAAKKGLLDRLAGGGRARILAMLPQNTRTLLVNQMDRWTIVAKDTMTDRDYQNLMDVLNSETLTAAEKAAEAMRTVYLYSNLRKIYDAQTFKRVAMETPEKAVASLKKTLGEFTKDSFVKEVPLDPFKSAEKILPELVGMRKAAENGKYRIVFEPTTAATKPNRIYADLVTKDTSRFGVDIWAPITNNVLDIDFGSRNRLGNIIDYLNGERTTSQVVANTLSRMQEFVVKNNIGLSRQQVIALHRGLTDYGFKNKGSIRTAADLELDSGSVGIIQKLIDETGDLDPRAKMDLLELKNNGTLRRMIFWAAEGDLNKVGVTTKATGMIKARTGIGKMATALADDIYPKAKFRYSPLFGMQEVIESKWWNLMRGYQDEWKVTVPGGDIRFGNKRFYDVTGPDGKTYKLDSLEIMSEAMISERVELKYAQEMAAINRYFSGSVTDAVLAFGSQSEGFVKALYSGIKGNPGPSKQLDYLKYVSAEGLDTLADDLSSAMAATAPEQYITWLAMAGGDKRGAALLFLKERQQLIRGRSTSRAFWESQKHYGIGFGRQYDDTPVKNLDRLRRDSAKIISNPLADQRNKDMRKVQSALSLIHADAAAIGYSKETLGAINEAQLAVESVSDVALTARNTISRKSQAAIDDAVAKIDNARVQIRKEFETAVARKRTVRDALVADGISMPLATEMASLYVVAERRSEMLPQVSNAVSRAMNGEKLSPAASTAMKDHLMKIRMARTEEETLWNSIGYGLDSAMDNADKTHFFTTNRGFLEKSINHPVFGMYPTSYMFGKVLPEYARMLFMSPTRSVAGVVLAPYMAIVKGVSFGKFSPEDWGKFAPLVGFSAMLKIRQAYVESESMKGEQEKNPLVYFLVSTMIPGLPTEISVSPSAPVRQILENVGTERGVTAGDIGYGIAQMAGNTFGFGRLASQTGDIIDQFTKKDEGDFGGGTEGPLGAAGEMIGNMAESVGDILLNRK